MKRLSKIGGLLKKIYRTYSSSILLFLQEKGFTDLRPSFLEILLFVCETHGPSIKEIGNACGLKKQTMTSHLNELQKRGYIVRKINEYDKREQNVFLTEFGERFKISLLESLEKVEEEFVRVIGDNELDRINNTLENMFNKLSPKEEGPSDKAQLNLSLDF